MLGAAGATVGDGGGVGATAAEEGAIGAVVDPVTGAVSGSASGFAGGGDALEAAGGGAVDGKPPLGRASSAGAGVSIWAESGGCDDCTAGCARTVGFAVDALGGLAAGVLLSSRGVASPCDDPVGSE